jgi:hypothetical protein
MVEKMGEAHNASALWRQRSLSEEEARTHRACAQLVRLAEADDLWWRAIHPVRIAHQSEGKQMP